MIKKIFVFRISLVPNCALWRQKCEPPHDGEVDAAKIQTFFFFSFYAVAHEMSNKIIARAVIYIGIEETSASPRNVSFYNIFSGIRALDISTKYSKIGISNQLYEFQINIWIRI